MPKVLHVGCGQGTLQNMPAGFQDGSWEEVRFDINPNVRPDIIGTITDMSNVASESVDAVYSSHNIEHVYTHEVPLVVREFRRVLKPDGFAVVTCPDLQAVAKHVADGKLVEPLYHSPSGPISALDIIYGHITAVARGETYMAHRTGFTATSLRDHFRRAFAMVGVRSVRFDLWVLATKGKVPEAEVREMMLKFLKP